MDNIISFLGRYGDPLNPWGDIMTVAEAFCVSSPNAKLAIAVPTSTDLGTDTILFNAHREYGHHLYPFLVSQPCLIVFIVYRGIMIGGNLNQKKCHF